MELKGELGPAPCEPMGFMGPGPLDRMEVIGFGPGLMDAIAPGPAIGPPVLPGGKEPMVL